MRGESLETIFSSKVEVRADYTQLNLLLPDIASQPSLIVNTKKVIIIIQLCQHYYQQFTVIKMTAVMDSNRLPPINTEPTATDASSTHVQGIYNGKYTDRSPFLTPVS